MNILVLLSNALGILLIGLSLMVLFAYVARKKPIEYNWHILLIALSYVGMIVLFLWTAYYLSKWQVILFLFFQIFGTVGQALMLRFQMKHLKNGKT